MNNPFRPDLDLGSTAGSWRPLASRPHAQDHCAADSAVDGAADGDVSETGTPADHNATHGPVAAAPWQPTLWRTTGAAGSPTITQQFHAGSSRTSNTRSPSSARQPARVEDGDREGGDPARTAATTAPVAPDAPHSRRRGVGRSFRGRLAAATNAPVRRTRAWAERHSTNDSAVGDWITVWRSARWRLATVVVCALGAWLAFYNVQLDPQPLGVSGAVGWNIREMAARNPWSAHFWVSEVPALQAVLWKVAFRNVNAVVAIQFVAHLSAWFALAHGVAGHLRTNLGRLSAWGLCALVAAEPAVANWTRLSTAESISISLAVAALAAWLHVWRPPPQPSAAHTNHDGVPAPSSSAAGLAALVLPAMWAAWSDSNSIAALPLSVLALAWLAARRSRNRSKGNQSQGNQSQGARGRAALGSAATLLFVAAALLNLATMFASGRTHAHISAELWEAAHLDSPAAGTAVWDNFASAGAPLGPAELAAIQTPPDSSAWGQRPDLAPYRTWERERGPATLASHIANSLRHAGSRVGAALDDADVVRAFDGVQIGWPQWRVPLIGSLMFPDSQPVLRATLLAVGVFALVPRLWRRRRGLQALVWTVIAGHVVLAWAAGLADFWVGPQQRLAAPLASFRSAWVVVAAVVIDRAAHTRAFARMHRALEQSEPAVAVALPTLGGVVAPRRQQRGTTGLAQGFAARRNAITLGAAITLAVASAAVLLALRGDGARAGDARATGYSRVALTPDARTDPTFSPGGRFMAWVHVDATRSELELFDRSTGATVELSDNDLVEGSPRFSPDGSALAFLGGTLQDGFGIFVIDLNGEPRTRQIAHTYFTARSLMWNPDGERLTFWSDRFHTLLSVDASRTDAPWPTDYLMLNPDGQRAFGIQGEWSPGSPISSLALTPLGRLLAGTDVDHNSELMVVDPPSVSSRRLTDDTATWPTDDLRRAPVELVEARLARTAPRHAQAAAVMTSDGRSIISCENKDSDFDVVRRIDAAVEPITHSSANECLPALSPFGEIALVSDATGEPDVYLLDAHEPGYPAVPNWAEAAVSAGDAGALAVMSARLGPSTTPAPATTTSGSVSTSTVSVPTPQQTGPAGATPR